MISCLKNVEKKIITYKTSLTDSSAFVALDIATAVAPSQSKAEGG